jgi:hypothetical protein
LPIDGTREEMIQRLKDHPANYGLRTSSNLTKMLKKRHAPGEIHGKKAVKIAKLKLNDDIDRDTGNCAEEAIFDKMDMLDATVVEKDAERRRLSDDCPYEHMVDDKLRALLTERGSIIPENWEVMIEIFQND